ncbi:SDR family NAD(P)-dependent oxidoreductase [Brevibacillus sp. SYP-B805]|uniref:SDR family NAD(P)-dependent oxidoreductase n=1 Tax=Brevibacillus sp. SYP-B805 TaxID=1578199 RepID=UPI0013ECE094|nr:SDR family NAD(P)-dependent oxidoreductase [Brevibacillus sp. SYP-B805]NGQ96778.1 SDR family NAD(P)-dependent oxidoreductase [Brevibacillus sp. SYP-B805]
MRLQGKVAVVTGASRGAGRGIALALGQEGATVYVTGRSAAGGPTTGNRPETIDETAALVRERGGVAIPVRVDHTNDEEVKALFERVKEEQGKLDILVNNAWGGNELEIRGEPFWELSTKHWDNMFEGGVRNHILSSRHAVPLMIAQQGGLIVHTSFDDNGKYTGHFYYDLAKNAINRMAVGMAHDLRPHGVTVLTVSPGWMRTELVLEDLAKKGETEKMVELTESCEYVGRAICAVAADPDRFAMTGTVQKAGELAKKYGFTDVDGRYIPPFVIPEG